MSQKIRIVGFSGCLRDESYNKAALRVAQELLPQNAELEILSIADLPCYSGDVSEDESTRDFVARLEQADAILIVTPEYKSLISNALKSALNWAGPAVLDGKLTAVMGFGRQAEAQAGQPLLRQLLARYGAEVLEGPELYAGREAFDDAGNLADEATRQQMRALLSALADKARDARSVLVG
ncbi:MAG: NAD(P)H-dependent oxidoreductase [Ktedonobacteraceae bacterium]|nr:NAD(P)H-dependent oxidoreductase [Ktedonobacteraceae bacterium]MBO0791909.1 NAD(P)H-dependent oxidoreductase [Ktedonobacteraceae bacterium]